MFLDLDRLGKLHRTGEPRNDKQVHRLIMTSRLVVLTFIKSHLLFIIITIIIFIYIVGLITFVKVLHLHYYLLNK